MSDQTPLSPLLTKRLFKRRLKASARRTFSNPWLYFSIALSLFAFLVVHAISRWYINSLLYDIPAVEVVSLSSCTTSAQDMLNLINEYRSNSHLTELKIDDRLNASAYLKAKDMISNGYWGHTSPDGTEPWDFMDDVGYDYRHAGENLGKDSECNEALVLAWKRSPKHNDNLLDPVYQKMGYAWIGSVQVLHLGVR